MPDGSVDITSLGTIVKDLGTIGLLAIGIVAWFKGWIHSDRELQAERAEKIEARQERDKWQDLSLDLLQTSNRATAVAESLASK